MYFSGKEVFFKKDELIVSKTDLDGRLTYANHTFLEVAGYRENEVIGKQHNIIRCPAMPRAIFELLWSTLQSGKEIFAYVVNGTKSGDHYWVIAHVTPSVEKGAIVGYHSTRRVPSQRNIQDVIVPLYDKLKEIETSALSKKEGLLNSVEFLKNFLAEKGLGYDEFMAKLARTD